MMLLAVRPVAIELLEPPLRIRFLQHTMSRFFKLVWGAIAILLLTGLWMLFEVFGGFASAAWHIHLMFALGSLMVLVFLVICLVPFRKLQTLVLAEQWPAAGAQLERIRKLVSINALLGVIVVLASSGGRYL
ncbi:MAG: CopD family protein [Motiliproteus sp.]